MSQDLSQRAKEIIDEVIYLNIATVDQAGQPWNSIVFTAYDEAYTFYWGSHINSQHSQNISQNEQVFLTIYDSTVPAGDGEGVYIKAEAQEVTGTAEIEKAHGLLQGRRPNPYWKLDQMRGAGPVRVYKATPEQAWMNDSGNKDGDYIDIRTEVNL